MAYRYFIQNPPLLMQEFERGPLEIFPQDFQGNLRVLVKDENEVYVGKATSYEQLQSFLRTGDPDMLDEVSPGEMTIDQTPPRPADPELPPPDAGHSPVIVEPEAPRDTRQNYDSQGNAKHYKGYLEGLGISLEWLEANQLEPFWRANPKAFYHAVLLLASRYTARLGGKDDELQEVTKNLWYQKFATAFAKNGYQPIRTADVDSILDPRHAALTKFARAINVDEGLVGGLLQSGMTPEEIELVKEVKNG